MFGIKSIYWILINSVLSFVFLFIFSKLLGKKQIAQLQFVDYAVGISFGSIAAEMAINPEQPFYYYLIAMGIFFIFAFLVELLGRKTPLLKNIIKGKPTTLIYDGKINWQSLVKCKIDVNDLLSLLREKNYFDINDVAYAIFEPSGQLSVLPKGNQKPVVIEDVDRSRIKPASLTNVMIVDGEISMSGLDEANKTKDWLFNRLQITDNADLNKIILATYDADTDALSVHYKENK